MIRFEQLRQMLSRKRQWVAGAIVLLASQIVHATATQEDVFKSISTNVDGQVDGRKLLAVIAVIVAIVIVAALYNNREARETVPKTLNHQGKLLRELKKSAGLSGTQIKQLKTLVEKLEARGEPVKSPVTLMLCPSLLQKAKNASS